MVAPTKNLPNLPELKDEFGDDGCSPSVSQSRHRPLSTTRPLPSLSTTELSSSSSKTTIKISKISATGHKKSYSNLNNNDYNPAMSLSSWDEDDNNDSSLEVRVAKLEEKLASLSHLLLAITTETSSHARKSLPELSPFHKNSPDLSPIQSTAPHLESTGIRRCLSHTILREESSSMNLQCPRLEMEKENMGETKSQMSPLPDQRIKKGNDRDREDQQHHEVTILAKKEHATLQSATETNISKKAPSMDTKEQNLPPERTARQKWMDYLESFQEPKPDVDNQMEEFVKVPSQLEGLLTFGLAICFDSFLYFLTMLPIKFLWSTFLLIKSPFSKVDKYRFHRRHFYNMIQVCNAYVVYRFILVPISIGQLYHWIRGQAMLKLYVLIAIVEVFDRLMCSMGQDCLDSLYWNTTKRPRSRRMLVSVTVVLVYTMCHTLLLFIHVATLNVAINSADQALLTLLISGNFAEIKSTVFKKYNKTNLFKITASDICERFKLVLFLTLVLILNISQGMDWKTTIKMLSMCGIVMGAEFVADWIKHSFITKFNFIRSKVYPQYSLLLAGDVTGFGHEGVNLDYSHAVVKRLGFAQIPLVCVMLRLMTEALRYYTARKVQSDEYYYHGWLALRILVIWTLLCIFKLMLGSYLQRICKAKLEAAPELKMAPISIIKKKL